MKRSALASRSADRRAGFSLIEALAALVIAAGILAAIASVAGQTLRNWNRGQAVIGNMEMLTRGLARVGVDLSLALPLRLPGADSGELMFQGTDRSILFAAATGLGTGDRGVELVALHAVSDGAKSVLMRRRGPVGSLGATLGDPVVLLSGNVSLRFFYRDAAGLRVSTWRALRHLPAIIELEIHDAAGNPVLPTPAVFPLPANFSVDCLLDTVDDYDWCEGVAKAPADAKAKDRDRRRGNR